jgi:hypothetical protein
MLGRQLPKVESMLREAADDITAFADFPVPHWKKIWSTSPLERLNKEIKRPHRRRRRLPNPVALLRLGGSVLVEAHDEWQVADKRYLSEIHPGPAQSHRPTRAEHLPPEESMNRMSFLTSLRNSDLSSRSTGSRITLTSSFSSHSASYGSMQMC